MKIKRIYHHFKAWEDYQNGMYRNVPPDEKPLLIERAKCLLSDPPRLYKAMYSVTKEWTKSTEENLTNIECNRKAWLGQAACCYECKVPEDLTRIAWGEIGEPEQIRANAVATKIIKEWELSLLNKKTNYAQAIIGF